MKVSEVKEKKVVNGTDLIYQFDRYYDKQSPFPIYIPTNEMFFKMMKACLGCKTEHDLWIYIKKDEL